MHLTRVAALDGREQINDWEDPDPLHKDIISLRDLMGAKDLKEAYQFNYMHDIPWVVSHVHADAHPTVHFIHGYKTPTNDEGQMFEAAAKMVPRKDVTINVHGVRLWNQFATHHSKIMVLFFENSVEKSARIVIHTANMIPFDWGNMTQGLWISPKLVPADSIPYNRFQHDITRYFRAYKIRAVTEMAQQLSGYDFSAVKDTLIASVPGNYLDAQWGLRRLEHELKHIRIDRAICQVSSVATLPKTFLEELARSLNTSLTNLKIVFPTVQGVKDSLNGYASGAALHFKRQTPAQLNQLDMLKPHLCEWKAIKARRDRAAPHIKTYFGLKDGSIAYCLVTSANLSKQAWGVFVKTKKSFWIQSWECGVLETGVGSPRYLGDLQTKLPHETEDVIDLTEPEPQQDSPESKQDLQHAEHDPSSKSYLMPYDLPTTPYKTQLPWSGQDNYLEPDWQGEVWVDEP